MLWISKQIISPSKMGGDYTQSTGIPPNFPDDLLGDANLLHEEKQWDRAVSSPGALVRHNDGWTGKVVELRGDPVNGGKVLVEHEISGSVVQRFYSALDLSPVLKSVSPFRRASNWLRRISQIIQIGYRVGEQSHHAPAFDILMFEVQELRNADMLSEALQRTNSNNIEDLQQRLEGKYGYWLTRTPEEAHRYNPEDEIYTGNYQDHGIIQVSIPSNAIIVYDGEEEGFLAAW